MTNTAEPVIRHFFGTKTVTLEALRSLQGLTVALDTEGALS